VIIGKTIDKYSLMLLRNVDFLPEDPALAHCTTFQWWSDRSQFISRER